MDAIEQLAMQRSRTAPGEARAWARSASGLDRADRERATLAVSELVTAALMLGATSVEATLRDADGAIRLVAEGPCPPHPVNPVDPIPGPARRVLDGTTERWGFDVQPDHVQLWALIIPAPEV